MRRTVVVVGLCIVCMIVLATLLGAKEKPFFPDPEQWEALISPSSIDVIADRVRSTHNWMVSLNFPDTRSSKQTEWEECQRMPQSHQLRDAKCSAVWLDSLRNGKIVEIIEMWGFENTHYGAITLRLETGEKAMFKPCSSKGEDTSKEILASHLDRVLGYGQTAPAITRRISIETLESLCTTESMRELLEVTSYMCGKKGYLVGPMIGWWKDLTPVRTITKRLENPEQEAPKYRASLLKNPYTAQMQSRYHSFYWLTNILRHGKDEFVSPYGELVSLDMDRSKFRSNFEPPEHTKNNITWCHVCLFDKWTVDSFRLVSPKEHPRWLALGGLMNMSLAQEGLWDRSLERTLNLRVKQYLSCVDNCIDRYGEDAVLLNEPRTLSSNELVHWYVSHSEYKKQNGKRKPDWF